MIQRALAGWMFAMCCSLSVGAQEKPVEDPKLLFEPRQYTGTSGHTLNYRLLKPSPYNADLKYPLVIFLHGAGERGSDNTAQLVHGMAEFCKTKWRQKYPCYVIAPQCPEGQKWVEVDWAADTHDMPAEPSEPLELVLELIDTMVKDSAVNEKRVIMTGLSMGGYGTWDALARRPGFFAGGLPICGGGDPKTAERLTKTPIWCFHGADDPVVKAQRSRDMIDAIKAAGGEPKYTEYPGVQHDSWTQTYADPAVIEWMFTQLRRDEPTVQADKDKE